MGVQPTRQHLLSPLLRLSLRKPTFLPGLIQQLPTWGQAGEGGLVLAPPAGLVWDRCGSQAAKCRATWWEELSSQSCGWTELLVSQLLVRVRLLVLWPAVTFTIVAAAKLWPLHNLLLRKQMGEFKPPSPSASVCAVGLAWSRWDGGCEKHSTGCTMTGDARRPVGIAVAAESCLLANSACCASPPGAEQHHGATNCSAICTWTYPEADCPSAQPRQRCHLCHQGIISQVTEEVAGTSEDRVAFQEWVSGPRNPSTTTEHHDLAHRTYHDRHVAGPLRMTCLVCKHSAVISGSLAACLISQQCPIPSLWQALLRAHKLRKGSKEERGKLIYLQCCAFPLKGLSCCQLPGHSESICV